MSLCLVSWGQILRYHSKWPVWKVTLSALVVACVFAGIEAALILTLTVGLPLPSLHGIAELMGEADISRGERGPGAGCRCDSRCPARCRAAPAVCGAI